MAWLGGLGRGEASDVRRAKTVASGPVRPFDDDRLYSCLEAAEVLGVSRWTPQRWISEELVRGFRVGRSIRIPGVDLNALLEPVGPSAGSYCPDK